MHSPLVRTAATNLALILTWYFFSTCLSLWNKRLVGKEHGVLGLGPFPAPMLITSVQFAFQHLLARIAIAMPWVTAPEEALSWEDWWKKVVANGISTGLDIGLSNYSLMLITLSFYTMCKSTTPVFLLTFAFIWGIERPSWSLAGVVLVICAGLLLLVAGETRFDLVGFLVVMGASMLAGFRWTITQVLLQGDAKGHTSAGGPVQVLYHLTPVMSVTVLVMSLLVERLWVVLPKSPYFASLDSLVLTFFIMLFGGFIAFFMVWTEFKVIQETSALTFMVAGTFKEIVTVFSAVVFLGETFTAVNALGLCILILGVVLFNWTKYKRLQQEATTNTDEGGKARPSPAGRPRYSLVDGSQSSSEDMEENGSRASTPGPMALGQSTPVMRGGASVHPFAETCPEPQSEV